MFEEDEEGEEESTEEDWEEEDWQIYGNYDYLLFSMLDLFLLKQPNMQLGKKYIIKR